MASLVKTPLYLLTFSRLVSCRKVAGTVSGNRKFSITYLRHDSGEKGGDDTEKTSQPTKNPSLDAEDARKKLRQLLMETRSLKKTKEIAPVSVSEKYSGRKKVKLAKPRLQKIAGDSEKENLEGLDPEMVYAAHRVATSSTALEKDDGKNVDGYEEREDRRQIKVRKIESDLLKRLKAVNIETEAAKTRGEVPDLKNLSSLYKSIEIDKTIEKSEDLVHVSESDKKRENIGAKQQLTAEQLAFLEKRRRLRQAQAAKEVEENYVPLDLFNSQPPLGIFSDNSFEQTNEVPPIELTMWKKCKEREMKILSSPTPKNFLDEMAVKTEQGILWKFPINNEQGIDEEKMEPFHAHVFLDHHLEPWCPKKGPIRHFMELVCVGLSKNPYISVEKKIEHISWYKDYFEKPEHNEILQVSGAIE